jgi:hypothetical protein
MERGLKALSPIPFRLLALGSGPIGSAIRTAALALGDDEDAVRVLDQRAVLLAAGLLAVVTHVVLRTVGEDLVVLRLSVELLRHHATEGRHGDALTLELVEESRDFRLDLLQRGIALGNVLQERRAKRRLAARLIDIAARKDELNRESIAHSKPLYCCVDETSYSPSWTGNQIPLAHSELRKTAPSDKGQEEPASLPLHPHNVTIAFSSDFRWGSAAPYNLSKFIVGTDSFRCRPDRSEREWVDSAPNGIFVARFLHTALSGGRACAREMGYGWPRINLYSFSQTS